jgi:hypothetical protein
MGTKMENQTHDVSTKNNDNQSQKTPSENTENKQNQDQQPMELLRGKADVLTRFSNQRLFGTNF